MTGPAAHDGSGAVPASVGILGGTGPAGKGLALRLAAAGVPVIVGSRDRERAASTVKAMADRWPAVGARLIAGANEDAAEAGVVVVATPWDAAVATARAHAGALAHKTVISMANALVRQGRELHALVPAQGSMTAALASALTGSSVVGALHHLPAYVLAELEAPLDADVLVCGEDEGAKREAIALIGRIAGLRGVDAGGLASAAPVEAFTAVLATLSIRNRAHVAIRLTGLDGSGREAAH